tara:strand:+ start:1011 stop:1208 length:198 start_codon:yes stop_codon:yes gene_type:complete
MSNQLKVMQLITNLLNKKKGLNRTGYNMHPGLVYKGKAKDYPGAVELAKKNVQGIYKKKGKFWEV